MACNRLATLATFPEPVSQASYDSLIAEVGDAYNGDPQINTFVIGSPGSEDNQGADYDNRSMMSRMAAAGGTATEGCNHDGPNYCHFDMTQEPEFLQALVDALGDIINMVQVTLQTVEMVQETVVVREETVVETVNLCSYPLPEPPKGQDLFLEEVKAIYYPGGGDVRQEIRQTTEEPPETCTEGWTFDDPVNPTTIEFCSATCERIQADPMARVEIEVGCYGVG